MQEQPEERDLAGAGKNVAGLRSEGARKRASTWGNRGAKVVVAGRKVREVAD